MIIILKVDDNVDVIVLFKNKSQPLFLLKATFFFFVEL